jgi:hypothetical protein
MGVHSLKPHVVRALLAFFVILVLFFGAIIVLKTLGEEFYPGFVSGMMGVEGKYGMDKEEKEKSREPIYYGSEACRECHEEIYTKAIKAGKHVTCETCHGAGYGHPDKSMKVEDTREACLHCHEPVLGRNIRVVEETHAEPRKCTLCHDAHSPWFT